MPPTHARVREGFFLFFQHNSSFSPFVIFSKSILKTNKITVPPLRVAVEKVKEKGTGILFAIA